MYPALAVILLALATLSVVVIRRSRQAAEAIAGFLYVGAVALVVLAGVVIAVGLVADRGARAEGLAIFGFFTYAIYLLAAILVERISVRR